MQALQVQQADQADEMGKFASIVKTAVGVFYLWPFLYLRRIIRLSGRTLANICSSSDYASLV